MRVAIDWTGLEAPFTCSTRRLAGRRPDQSTIYTKVWNPEVTLPAPDTTCSTPPGRAELSFSCLQQMVLLKYRRHQLQRLEGEIQFQESHHPMASAEVTEALKTEDCHVTEGVKIPSAQRRSTNNA